MTGRAFLSWIRHGDEKIRRLQEDRKFLMLSMYPGANNLKIVQVQESAPGDKMADTFGEIDLITARIEAITDELDLARGYAQEVISEIEKSHHRDVLTLYYLSPYTTVEVAGKAYLMSGTQKLTWYDVAGEMHLPIRKVHRLHHAALDRFEALADALPDKLPN